MPRFQSPKKEKRLAPAPTGWLQMSPTLRQASKVMLAQAVEALKATPDKWHGQCFGIASAFVKHKIAPGTAVYGHWLGHIASSGYWKDRAGSPFVHHGWVQSLEGDLIIDPTRFSFEDVEPYVYIGTNDCYDEGGNAFRSAFERPCPAYIPPEKATEVYHETRDISALEPESLAFLKLLCGNQPGFTTEMLFWVANLHPERLGDHQDAIYGLLCRPDMHLDMAIPNDNRRAWERKKGKK